MLPTISDRKNVSKSRGQISVNRRSQIIQNAGSDSVRNQNYGAVSKTLENGRNVESAMDDRKSSMVHTGGGKPRTTNRNHRPAETSNAKYGASPNKNLIKARTATVEDLPSDLSDDEWGEVQKYGQILHLD